MQERKNKSMVSVYRSLVTIIGVSLFVMLTILSATTQITAQELPSGDPRNEAFRKHFIEVKNLNSEIKNFNTLDVGQEYKMPNTKTDKLETGDLNGIWGREFKKFYGISYNDFKKGQKVSSVDPTTSGPPVVNGGINPNETDRLRNYFDNLRPRGIRVSPVEAGNITGEGNVAYGNGSTQHHVITTPLRAYRATYRFPDGHEETIVTLQKCMNPVGSGGATYSGFTFTPDSEVVPTLGWWNFIPWWGWLLGILAIPVLIGIGSGVYKSFFGSKNQVLPQKEEIEKLTEKEKADTRKFSFPVTQAATLSSVPTTEIVPVKKTETKPVEKNNKEEEIAKAEGFQSAEVKNRHDNFVQSMFSSEDKSSTMKENIEDDKPKVFSLKVRKPTKENPNGLVETEGLDAKVDNVDLSVGRDGQVKLTYRFDTTNNPDSPAK